MLSKAQYRNLEARLWLLLSAWPQPDFSITVESATCPGAANEWRLADIKRLLQLARSRRDKQHHHVAVLWWAVMVEANSIWSQLKSSV